ncbi:MAG: nicotinate-nucleotide adenylyltransferase [Clostridiales bacterium]|nr:nicotinate-nucleotide adenylyltransferase [Roseburia sp.]MDD7635951.1 nicotinate-nucleotide adenylyltransferase [Clostridiales bacterium]MDY4111735.1 nicotinate-nucleotide adenylyltransferase [Roseburia sp.]
MERCYDCKKIGILGGSFDPIHQGHLNIAEYARAEFRLDEIWFIPAGHSPNKREADMTPAEVRLEMVALAIADYPYYKLSRVEVDAKETSYTYLTLSKLAKQYPITQFYFIMGADSLDYLEKWRHPEIICKKAIILAAVRDDMDIVQIEQKILSLKELFEAEIYPIQGGRTNISSTTLRRQLADCREKPELLPAPVWKYICENGLYGCKSEK